MRPALILLAALFGYADVRDSASETRGDDGSGVLGV